MTKMKSKKMTKSTFAIIIMGIVMVAMLAFGGTFAYFTATTTDKSSGDITTGYISLKAGDTVTMTGNTSALLPKETITAKLEYTDSSTRGTWIVIEATADQTKLGTGATLTLSDIALTETGLTAAKYTKDGSIIFVIENSDKAADDKVTSAKVTASVTATYDATEENKDGQAASALNNMGKTFSITFKAKSVQHLGNANAAAALTALGYTGYTLAE